MNIAEKTTSVVVKGAGQTCLSAVKGVGAIGSSRILCYVESSSESSGHSPAPHCAFDLLPSSP
jgi:hypothetical protein